MRCFFEMVGAAGNIDLRACFASHLILFILTPLLHLQTAIILPKVYKVLEVS
jgi:hypothetical protein